MVALGATQKGWQLSALTPLLSNSEKDVNSWTIHKLGNVTDMGESGLLSRSTIKTSPWQPSILSVRIKVCVLICHYNSPQRRSVAISRGNRLLFCHFAPTGWKVQKERLLGHQETSYCHFQFRSYSQGCFSATEPSLSTVLIYTYFGSLGHSTQGEI